jgi:hypothetical protein
MFLVMDSTKHPHKDFRLVSEHSTRDEAERQAKSLSEAHRVFSFGWQVVVVELIYSQGTSDVNNGL